MEENKTREGKHMQADEKRKMTWEQKRQKLREHI